MITNFEAAIAMLADGGVEFIVIGGVAATLHGSPRTTADLDVVYRRTRENMHRLVESLASHSPYLRGAPPGLPFRWDLATIRNGLNFTLDTDLGDLDLLGEVVGGGTYDELLPHCHEVVAFGRSFRIVKLAKLIELKRAAGRSRDLEVLAELQLILERQRRGGRSD